MTSNRKDTYKTIAEVKDENLGINEEGKADFFTMKGTIVFIKNETMSYPACRSDDCNKKVVEIDPGAWKCEKCSKSFPKPQYRYVLLCSVVDHTGQIFLSGFDDTGRLIMGRTADEVQELKESGEDAKVDQILQEAYCRTYIFRCKARMENYKDEQRVRYQIMTATPLNYKSECIKLMETLERFRIDSDSLFVQ